MADRDRDDDDKKVPYREPDDKLKPPYPDRPGTGDRSGHLPTEPEQPEPPKTEAAGPDEIEDEPTQLPLPLESEDRPGV